MRETTMRKLLALALACIAGPAAAQDSAAYTDQASQQRLIARMGGNVADTTQEGSGNVAETTQSGAGNTAIIRQSGTGNMSVIRQGGSSLGAESLQNGTGLGVTITQSGMAGNISVTQTAPGAIIQRSGPGAVTVR
jgi:hypothetical protein